MKQFMNVSRETIAAVEVLNRWFSENGIPQDPSLGLLSSYIRMVLSENRVRNITGASGGKELAEKHIIPSIELSFLIEEKQGVDVGSGNGLPGVVTAVLDPSREVTLMEPMRRRASFLRGVAGGLGLGNSRVVEMRAEEAGRTPSFRGAYGFATARAVAPLRASVEIVLPLLRSGGRFYAQPGLGAAEKAAAASDIIGDAGGVVERIVSGTVVIKKTGETPPCYPRSWKRIKKASELEKPPDLK